jgi:hypothetical protein
MIMTGALNKAAWPFVWFGAPLVQGADDYRIEKTISDLSPFEEG